MAGGVAMLSGMWTYQPRHVATQAPRYTSYPTAAEFTGAVGAADQERALAAVAPGATLSLYVHIPYCEIICWYCGCNTGAANRADRLDAYIDALHTEIAAVAQRLAGRGTVEAIHFGGGSPNVLPAQSLAAIIAALRRRFPTEPDVDIAVEVDPRGLDASYIDRLAAAGVTRVSLGVQTFSPRVQARINRIQPYEMVADAVRHLRDSGIKAVNFDLMYGLPGQMVEDVVDTVDRAARLGPDRIAVFGYAHMPSMLPRQRMIDDRELPGSVARFAQARVASQRLIGLGYESIGFDHFARPDDPLAVAARNGSLRRNFQGFTDDPADVLIGFGASAISDFGSLIVQNEKQAGAYRGKIFAGQLAGVRGTPRTAEDRLRGDLIEALLCQGEADVGAICRRHGRDEHALDAELAALQPLVVDGLARVSGRNVIVPPEALPFSRLVARGFDAYRASAPGPRFSRAV